jgi:hypothetical protein
MFSATVTMRTIKKYGTIRTTGIDGKVCHNGTMEQVSYSAIAGVNVMHRQMWIVMVMVVALGTGATVAEAGGPAGGIGFNRSWGTSSTPPVQQRSSSNVGTARNAPIIALPPRSFVRRPEPFAPNGRGMLRYSPPIQYPDRFYEDSAGCPCR